jgi:hypothetical protein
MSVRIIAPPARVLPVHDDGAFRLTTSSIVDDDSWRPFFWTQVPPNLTLFLSDDEVSLAAQIDDDSGTPALWIARALIVAQPPDADDDLSITPRALFDDAQLVTVVLAAPGIAQPPYDDEVGATLKKFGLDDDCWLPRFTWDSSIRPLVYFDSDDLPQVVVTIVDEDGFLLLARTNALLFGQPLADDDGTQLKNFALEHEFGGPLPMPLASVFALPASIEVDWIPLVAIDEDPFVITFTIPSKGLSQPLNDDEVGPQLKNFALDDDPMLLSPLKPVFLAQPLAYEEIVIQVTVLTAVGNRTIKLGARSVQVAIHRSTHVEVH